MSHSMRVRRITGAHNRATHVGDPTWAQSAIYNAACNEPMLVDEDRAITLNHWRGFVKAIDAVEKELDLDRNSTVVNGELVHLLTQFKQANAEPYQGIIDLCNRMVDPEARKDVNEAELANQKQKFVAWFEQIGRTLKELNALSPKPQNLTTVLDDYHELVDDLINLGDKPAVIVDAMQAERLRVVPRNRADNEEARRLEHRAPHWREGSRTPLIGHFRLP